MLEQRNIKKNVDQSILCLHQSRRKKEGRKSQGTPRYAWVIVSLFLLFTSSVNAEHHIRKKYEIKGGISPKSIVASGTGLFAAQNMMYRHTITIYNKTGKLLAKIKDGIDLSKYGFDQYESGNYMGAPVEAEFTDDGKYLWVSNYNMFGKDFNKPGCDACNGNGYDPGFLYKISMEDFTIENVVQVGAVPKYLSISEDEELMIVSNWTSGDISIVDLKEEREIKKVFVGPHPRGVAITKDAKKVFVTVMGSTKIAEVNLETYDVKYLTNIGRSPRHVVLSNDDKLLYIAVNSSNTVVKYDIASGEKEVCSTNSGPRTMVLSPNQEFLYVVNYFSNTFSKIQTDSMKVVEVVETGNHPIGITANWEDAEVWVACYTGKIEVFKDFELAKMNEEATDDWGIEFADFLPYFEMEEGKTSSFSEDEVIISDGNKEKEEVPKMDSVYLLNIEGDVEIKEVLAIEEEQPVKINKLSPKIASGDIRFPEIVNDTVKTIEELIVVDVIEKYENEIATNNIQPKKGTELISESTIDSKHIREKENDNDCSYHIIVGSFSIHSNAVNYSKEMVSKGYPAQILETNKGMTYVSVQCFSSREKASASISKVYEDIDVKGWILKR